MPVTQKNALTLGPGVIDVKSFGTDVPGSVIAAFERLSQVMVGMGYPAPASSGDEDAGDAYQNVYAQYDGAAWLLYAGKPSDPLNPDLVTVSSGSATIIVEQDESVINANVSTINFEGDVAVVDDGSGQVTVTVTGVAGSSNSFETIAVPSGTSAVADSATDTLTLAVGNYISIVGSDPDTITIACTLTAGTYIDISGTAINVDLTEVAGYDAAKNQYLNNANGTIQWKDSKLCDG